MLCEEAGVISITEVLMVAWTGMIESLEPPESSHIMLMPGSVQLL